MRWASFAPFVTTLGPVQVEIFAKVLSATNMGMPPLSGAAPPSNCGTPGKPACASAGGASSSAKGSDESIWEAMTRPENLPYLGAGIVTLLLLLCGCCCGYYWRSSDEESEWAEQEDQDHVDYETRERPKEEDFADFALRGEESLTPGLETISVRRASMIPGEAPGAPPGARVQPSVPPGARESVDSKSVTALFPGDDLCLDAAPPPSYDDSKGDDELDNTDKI
jgi:hypothetical protein